MHTESSKQASFMAVTMILLFLFTFPFNTNQTSTDNTTFTFSTFSSDMPEIISQGDAVLTDQTISLSKSLSQLISDGNSFSAGRAAYFKQFHLWDNASGHVADFNTHFSFVIDSENNNTKGSGMTFFLVSDFDRLPSLSSLPIEFLGLSSDQKSHTGRARYVAVEFDTYVSEIDTADKEHIGIDINSMSSSIYVEWSKNDIYNGGRIEAWIEYDSSSNNLSFLVKNGDTEYYNSENSYSSFYIVNLTEHLTEWVTFGFTAATTIDNFELHRIYYWEFHSSLKLEESTVTNHTDMPKRRHRSLWAFLATGCALLFVLFLGMVCFGYWRMKRRRQQREGSRPASCTNQEFEKETGPRSFSYEELVVATNNFAKDRILGKGGFGMVYMGFWSNGDSCIAVKKFISESEEALKAYASEVTTIRRLRHRNLVQLLGWCRNKRELLIVYEFMPNKSLDFHLFNKTGLLKWEERFSIALGLASGLLYLHEECEQCVLHRDIKSSNVLLDSNFNAKLGDFGLARLVEHGQGSDTTRLIGTVGYVSPEYLNSSKATKESDVYSFGVVALEIASGRPAFKDVDADSGMKLKCKTKLVEWVWKQYRRGNILGVADPQLNQDYVVEEMERLIVIGLACAHPDHCHRLSIREAIDVLNAKAPLPVLPLEVSFQPNNASYHADLYPFSAYSTVDTAGNTQSSTSTTSHSTK